MADRTRRQQRGIECVDCGIDTCPTEIGPRAESYMVYDEVWAAAGIAEDGGRLCIGCLEDRIGRQLSATDFTDVKLNDLSITDGHYAWSWRTPRLVGRLSGQLSLPFDAEAFDGLPPKRPRGVVAGMVNR